MNKLLKSLGLLVIAMLLSLVLLPVGLCWTLGEILVRWFFPSGKSAGAKGLGYLSSIIRSVAVGIDQIGNSVCRDLFNRSLIVTTGYPFGKINETISSVLGKNERGGTLTPLGIGLVKSLDLLEKEHCKKSIQDF